MGEIDDFGRLIDKDKTESYQAVRTALGNPGDQQLNDVTER
jgi:hypothetical protein